MEPERQSTRPGTTTQGELPPPGETYWDPSRPRDGDYATHQVNPTLELVKAWIEMNQTPAMLGAFAAGVFMGVMMRR